MKAHTKMTSKRQAAGNKSVEDFGRSKAKAGEVKEWLKLL